MPARSSAAASASPMPLVLPLSAGRSAFSAATAVAAYRSARQRSARPPAAGVPAGAGSPDMRQCAPRLQESRPAPGPEGHRRRSARCHRTDRRGLYPRPYRQNVNRRRLDWSAEDVLGAGDQDAGAAGFAPHTLVAGAGRAVIVIAGKELAFVDPELAVEQMQLLDAGMGVRRI